MLRPLALALALAAGALPTTAHADHLRVRAPRLAVQPELPSVDRIQTWIRDRIGDEASTELRVCIATDGRVTSVSVLRPSSYLPFDRAVMQDVRAWRFAAAAVPRCLPTTIVYQAR